MAAPLPAAALCAALWLALGACGTSRRTVPVEPREVAWVTVQGDVRRSARAAESAPEDPEVVWRESVGRGLRSEVLEHTGVLVVTGSNRLLATYSAEDGGRYWEHRLDGSVGGGAVWRNDTLWLATETVEAEALAITLHRGQQAWERDVPASPHAPLLHGSLLVLATEPGPLLALDAASGRIEWRTALPGGAAGTPVPHGDRLLVLSRRDTLYSVDIGSGRIQDRAALPGTPGAAAALADTALVIPTHGGDLVAVHATTLEPLWAAPLGAPILAAPVVAGDGLIHALASDGGVWSVDPGGRADRIAALGGAASGSLTLAANGLLVGRLDGSLTLLRRDGSVIWTRDLGDSLIAPVTVSGGALYVPLLRGSIVKLR